MKKIHKVITVQKPVEELTELWVTSDGKEWRDEIIAKKHEDKLQRKATFAERYRLTKIEGYEYFFIPDKVTEDNLEDLFVHFGRAFSTSGIDTGWNMVTVDNSGDYAIVSYDSLRQQIEYHDDEMRRLIQIQIQLNKILDEKPVSTEIPQSSIDAMNHAEHLQFGEKL